MRTPMLRRTILALLGLLLPALATNAATLKETFQKTYPLRAGEKVTLRNVNGAVVVEAWDRAEVQVVAEKAVKAGDAELAKKAMSQIQIQAGRADGGLRIETKLPKRNNGVFDWMFGRDVSMNVAYRLRVPREARLDVVTVNGGLRLAGTRGDASLGTTNGGIEVEKAEGRLELATTNGAIQVADSAGSVEAETTNGGIEIELHDVAVGDDMRFSTTNGAVTLRLPRDIRVSLDAAVSNGRVSSDFEVDGADARNRRRLSGDINGGGGRLVVRTTNGSVTIEEI
ncbi:MAG TPA: DUF4097 family beta strand repeat-containing protein [Thermoanaerobaculia bacterium]|nr:DUF4097 family beta strand repeat-containing protein [Thermoanaerobaculia bacterium]